MLSDTIVQTHKELGAGYRLLTLEAPEITKEAQPGQFVQLRVPAMDASALRRPFSICNAEDGILTILYKQVGRGTEAMKALREGDKVNILGPLGKGFTLPKLGTRALLVGGGFGVAPLYFFARIIRAAMPDSPAPVLFVGGRTADDVLLTDWFTKIGVEVQAATNDGSLGMQGLVTAPLDAWREANPDAPVALYACGPAPMLKAIDERALAWKAPGYISLDRRMACGFGACLGCTQVIRVAGSTATARVCADGPVFKAGQIVWEEV